MFCHALGFSSTSFGETMSQGPVHAHLAFSQYLQSSRDGDCKKGSAAVKWQASSSMVFML